MSGVHRLCHAIDLRSDERVVVLASPQSVFEYPSDWVRPGPTDGIVVNEFTVVVIDRIDVGRSLMCELISACPRMLAIAVVDVDHEKQVRRSLTALYPWSEVWTFYTDFGKMLVTNARGEPYDRDHIVDQRLA